ncbi:MAG TPA: hypothetical protein VER96_04875 [Polyangiaceae bacterium]|nr:hypothetical protein [Polyangiaceae bacterium]
MPTQSTPLSALALGLSLFGLSACSSFDPVPETHFVLLNSSTYESLGMTSGPRWVVYDDQHSPTFSCTNGAAGKHAPEDCSLIYKEPRFKAGGPKCLWERDPSDDGALPEPGPEGICIQGVRRPMLHCEDRETAPDRCFDDADGDESNMWGAGVGLSFSAEGTTAWNPNDHGVTGIAFEFTGPKSVKENLRVGIPTLLNESAVVSSERPLTRSDATVIDKNGKVYTCNGTSVPPVQRTNTLADVRVDGQPSTLTSGQHPSGSSYWQEGSSTSWVASPVVDGQNQFDLSKVLPPPLKDSGSKGFEFDRTQMLGIHFQVAYQENKHSELQFGFCIKNLALILK